MSDPNVNEAQYQASHQDFMVNVSHAINRNKGGALFLGVLGLAAFVYQSRKVAISRYNLNVVTDEMKQLSKDCSYFNEVATAQGERVLFFQEELAKTITKCQRIVVYVVVALAGSCFVVAIIVVVYKSVQGKIQAAEKRGKEKAEDLASEKAEKLPVEIKQLRSSEQEQDTRALDNRQRSSASFLLGSLFKS